MLKGSWNLEDRSESDDFEHVRIAQVNDISTADPLPGAVTMVRAPQVACLREGARGPDGAFYCGRPRWPYDRDVPQR
jgi:hypothetical protein